MATLQCGHSHSIAVSTCGDVFVWGTSSIPLGLPLIGCMHAVALPVKLTKQAAVDISEAAGNGKHKSGGSFPSQQAHADKAVSASLQQHHNVPSSTIHIVLQSVKLFSKLHIFSDTVILTNIISR